MNKIQKECPDRQILQQFLLGQLSLPDIEDCKQHLSQCDPCVETIEGLKISDTFADVTRQALQALPGAEVTPDDEQLIEKMIDEAQGWSSTSVQTNPAPAVSLDKAAEVQRLLRDPVEVGDIGSIGHFRLLQLIGAGSTGIVYLAIDTKLDRDVVLKVLRPSLGEAARKRFVAEAKATAAINHPNVVTIYEVGSDGPLSFIAMQWIPGQTLEEKLASEESLGVDETRKLVEEIAGGLDAAHEKSLIHRDIKPANVWIPAGDESAKILDFGLVRVNDEDPQLTCTGMIAGTPCFMSPEQSRGDKLDQRSDLFSLGCLAYQCLTGRLPFRSDNALATLRSVQQDQPTPPAEMDPSIDSDFSDLVMCLLEKSPARRPESAQILIGALKTESSKWPFTVSHHERPARKPDLQKSRSWWKSIAALLVIAAMGAFGFAYHEQIIRIATDQGEIVIDTKVDDVKIEIVGEGNEVRVIDLATDQSIEIKSGQYEIRSVGDENSVVIDKNVLTLSRGETEIVKITRDESAVSENGGANIGFGFTSNSDSVGEIDSISRLMIIEPAIVQLEAELAENLKKYQPNHPKISSIKDRLNFYRSMLEQNDEADRSFLAIQLAHTDPDAVADTVSSLLGIQPEKESDVKIDVDDRQRRLLVYGTKEHHKLILRIVEEIDQPSPEDQPYPIEQNTGGANDTNAMTAVVKLLHSEAQYMADRIKPILGSNTDSLGPPRITVDERSNGLLIAGDRAYVDKVIALVDELDQPSDLDPSVPYKLDSGDVLGIFIDGVLGQFDQSPPVHQPSEDSKLPPAIGYPIQIDHDGTIALPFVKAIYLRDKTLAEARVIIDAAYHGGDNPLLRAQARVIVSLMRPRQFNAFDVNRTNGPALQVPHPNPGQDASMPALEVGGGPLPALARNKTDSEGDSEVGAALPFIKEKSASQPSNPFRYDGRTYQQWLSIARSERDLAKLNPAIKGIANLAGDEHRKEMLDTIIEIARRGPGYNSHKEVENYHSSIRNILSSQALDVKMDLFMGELKEGNDSSRIFFGNHEVKDSFDFDAALQKDFEATRDQIDQLLATLNQFADTPNRTKQAFYWVVQLFLHRQAVSSQLEKLAVQDNQDCQSLLQKEFDSVATAMEDQWFGSRSDGARQLKTIARFYPRVNGLSEKFKSYVMMASDNRKAYLKTRVADNNPQTVHFQWDFVNEIYPALEPEDRPVKEYIDLANGYFFTGWNESGEQQARIVEAMRNLGFELDDVVFSRPMAIWKPQHEFVRKEDGSLVLRMTGDIGVLDIAANQASEFRSSRDYETVERVERYIARVNNNGKVSIKRDPETNRFVIQGKDPQTVLKTQLDIAGMLEK